MFHCTEVVSSLEYLLPDWWQAKAHAESPKPKTARRPRTARPDRRTRPWVGCPRAVRTRRGSSRSRARREPPSFKAYAGIELRRAAVVARSSSRCSRVCGDSDIGSELNVSKLNGSASPPLPGRGRAPIGRRLYAPSIQTP